MGLGCLIHTLDLRSFYIASCDDCVVLLEKHHWPILLERLVAIGVRNGRTAVCEIDTSEVGREKKYMYGQYCGTPGRKFDISKTWKTAKGVRSVAIESVCTFSDEFIYRIERQWHCESHITKKSQ